MEFIPLESDNEKTNNKKKVITGKSAKKSKIDEGNKGVNFQKTKQKSKNRLIEKKNVKNKYKETLALKRLNNAPKKKKQKKNKVDDEKVKLEGDGEEIENENENEEVEEEEVEEEEEEEVVEDEVHDDDEENKKAEEAFKRKCKELDEKMKNRLFIKLKKKIINETMVKELHPNIKSVIFPRKKNSRWCWAVFASEEKANETLKQLSKNKEVLAAKPNPYERVIQKQKEKMKSVLRKKETKKKLQNIWI